MKPFPEVSYMSEAEMEFNNRLSKCRRVVENAFGQLKARFRKIGRGLELDISNAITIIQACCVLHNFLNEINDTVWIQWLENLPNTHQEQRATTVGSHELDGMVIRQALMIHFQDQ